MANFIQNLMPPVSFIALLLVLTSSTMTKPVRAQGDTTSFTYDFYGSKPRDLTYQGDAHFPSETTYLRLTGTQSSGGAETYSAGRVLYANPVRFSDRGAEADFETTIKFRITPDHSDDSPADGLAFFIAPVGSTIPSASTGGGLGVFGSSGSSSSVFAVEFDAYVNEWDPRYRHVGIDIESVESRNVTEVGDALIGQEVTARVGYVAATNVISVRVDAGSRSFEVRYVYDLSKVLPERVQVGISASTGLHVAVHDVISWYFTSTIVQKGYAGAGDFIRQFA